VPAGAFGPGTPASTITAGTQDNYTWASEVRQPLFAGGGILANYEVNKLGFDISRMEKAATVQDIVQEVKVSYFQYLKAEKLLGVARQSLEQLQAHLNIAKNFFEVGLIPRNDVLQSEVQVANGEQSLIRAENSVELARRSSIRSSGETSTRRCSSRIFSRTVPMTGLWSRASRRHWKTVRRSGISY